MAIKGIDVSAYQGVIDWKRVKAAGIGFAIIRVGLTHYQGGLTPDARFEENIKGALAAKIPVGVYAFSYDLSPEAARISAKKVLEAVKGYALTYPIWFDQEYGERVNALSRLERTEICAAFCREIESAGYYSGIYASRDWFLNWLDDKSLSAFDHWVAAYRQDLPEVTHETSGYTGAHGMWQYTVLGTVGTKGRDYQTYGRIDGIDANVDVNVSYRDYPSIIRNAGLNGLSPENEPETDSPAVNGPPEPDYKALYEAAQSEIAGLKEQLAKAKTLTAQLLEVLE